MKTRSRKAGFTLVEALIASLVFAVGIAAMVTLWITAERVNLNSKYVSLASQLARHDLERMRGQGFDNLPIGLSDGVGGGTWTGSDRYYTRNLTTATTESERFFTLRRDIIDINVADNTQGTGYTLTRLSQRRARVRVWLYNNGDEVASVGTWLVSGGI